MSLTLFNQNYSLRYAFDTFDNLHYLSSSGVMLHLQQYLSCQDFNNLCSVNKELLCWRPLKSPFRFDRLITNSTMWQLMLETGMQLKKIHIDLSGPTLDRYTKSLLERQTDRSRIYENLVEHIDTVSLTIDSVDFSVLSLESLLDIHVSSTSKVHTLHLKNCKLNEGALTSISSMHSLQELRWENTTCCDFPIGLLQLPSLQRLKYYCVAEEDVTMEDQDECSLIDIETLNWLADALQSASHLTHICLDVRRSSKLKNTLKCLTRFPNMCYLSLLNIPTESLQVNLLIHLPDSIVELHLHLLQPKIERIRYLTVYNKLINLRKLSVINECRLLVLSISGCITHLSMTSKGDLTIDPSMQQVNRLLHFAFKYYTCNDEYDFKCLTRYFPNLSSVAIKTIDVATVDSCCPDVKVSDWTSCDKHRIDILDSMASFNEKQATPKVPKDQSCSLRMSAFTAGDKLKHILLDGDKINLANFKLSENLQSSSENEAVDLKNIEFLNFFELKNGKYRYVSA